MKLLFIITILLISLKSNAFLTPDTLPTKVVLQPVQATKVIRDLVTLDACQEIRKVMEASLINCQLIITEKNTVIREKDLSLEREKQTCANYQVMNKALEIRLTKATRNGRFAFVVTVGVGALALWQTLK